MSLKMQSTDADQYEVGQNASDNASVQVSIAAFGNVCMFSSIYVQCLNGTQWPPV